MNQCCLHFSWFIKENHSGESHLQFTKCEKWFIDDSIHRSLGGVSFIFYSVQKILRKESFWIHENSRALGDLFVLVNTDKKYLILQKWLYLSVCVWGCVWTCIFLVSLLMKFWITPHSLFQCSKLCLQSLFELSWMCSDLLVIDFFSVIWLFKKRKHTTHLELECNECIHWECSYLTTWFTEWVKS